MKNQDGSVSNGSQMECSSMMSSGNPPATTPFDQKTFVDPIDASPDQINNYVNMLSSILHSFRCGQLTAEARARGLDITNTCRMVQCTKSSNILHHILACEKDVCYPICMYTKKLTDHFNTCSNQTECRLCSRVIDTDPLMEWKSPMTREFRDVVVNALVTKLGVDETDMVAPVRAYFDHIESQLFDELAVSQEHYFCVLFEKFNQTRDRIIRLRGGETPASISDRSSVQGDFNNGNRRLPYDPDASAGEHGPPNMIAPTNNPSPLLGNAYQANSEVSTINQSDHKDEKEDSSAESESEVVVSEVEPPPPRPLTPSSADLKVQLDPNVMRIKLLSLLEKVRANENAIPFAQPVDPVALCIPDYFDVVKNPMDLSTMEMKAGSDDYRLDPMKFVNDMYLMFDNAILYNKKQTKVHKMCLRLRECYESIVPEYASDIGLCCGLRPHFSPQTIYCYGGKPNCNSIKPQQVYYCYTNETPQPNLNGNLYGICVKCFDSDKNDDSISLGDNIAEPLVVLRKSCFVQMKNTKLEEEPIVTCTQCHRKYHQICELYYENMEKRSKFVCSFCRKRLEMPSRVNRFTSAKLPHYSMSRHIEEDVNRLLREKKLSDRIGKVHVRVLCSYDKIFHVKEKTRIYYKDDAPENGFPYRAKAIFVFEELDGVDVAFFAMHVHEYGSDCPLPNKNRVYISYLDSVHYFQPYKLKTDIYHRVIISYLSFAKSRGFEFAHIWACPPNRGDDYIFYYHPKGQKVPEQRRLANWYRVMLDKAKKEGVVMELRDVISDMVIRGGSKSLDIPYFEGDFFSAAIEDELHNLFQKLGKQTANKEEDVRRKGLGTKTGKHCAKKSCKYFECKDEVTEKVANLMEKHKDVFFIMKLNEPPLHDVKDPDPLMYSDMMSGRDCFLNFCRDRNFEYSTLRRSKYTTMAFLYELHTQGVSDNDEFCYTCDLCSCSLANRYHCTKCEDFDLCSACYESRGHDHEMQLINIASRLNHLAIEETKEETKKEEDKSEIDSQEMKQRVIQNYVDCMLHAIECRNANCRLGMCRSMKSGLEHVHLCSNNSYPNVPRGECQLCHKLYALACNHAKNCREVECAFPFCPLVKSVIQQQRNKSELMDKRRMMMMNRMAQTPGNSKFPSPENEDKEEDEDEEPATPSQVQVRPIGSGGKDFGQSNQIMQQHYAQANVFQQAPYMHQMQYMHYGHSGIPVMRPQPFGGMINRLPPGVIGPYYTQPIIERFPNPINPPECRPNPQYRPPPRY